MRKYSWIFIAAMGLTIMLIGCGKGETASGQNVPNTTQTPQGIQQAQADPKPTAIPAAGQAEAGLRIVPAKSISALPILYYHSVMIEPGNELRMPPKQFTEQMSYLAKHGYHSITPEQLEQFYSGQGVLPDKPFLLTFDDGYVDNYTNALPVLQKYGFTALVFVVSSYIDGSGFLSDDQLRSLVAAGWTIGGHTVNHAHLTKLNPASQIKELRDSKQYLEKKLGVPVHYFAYPFGEYNTELKKLLHEEGYRLAFTTERGWAEQGSDPYLLHRVYCYANMGMKEFQRRIENPKY
ncbi:MAG: polysaccharide deacetylase family protein [Desulfitobacteriaceae bacterium]